MQRTLLSLIALLIMVGFSAGTALAQSDDVEARPTVTVTDASINAGDVVHWTNDNVYNLDGPVL